MVEACHRAYHASSGIACTFALQRHKSEIFGITANIQHDLPISVLRLMSLRPGFLPCSFTHPVSHAFKSCRSSLAFVSYSALVESSMVALADDTMAIQGSGHQTVGWGTMLRLSCKLQIYDGVKVLVLINLLLRTGAWKGARKVSVDRQWIFSGRDAPTLESLTCGPLLNVNGICTGYLLSG